MPGETNTFIPALLNFNEFLTQRESRLEERDKKRKSNILSTNFINQLQGAQTQEEVSEITLKGNKIAASTGIPELANLINNYSRIKSNEIDAIEETRISNQTAEAITKQYGDIESFAVSPDGEIEIGQLKDLPAFQNALLADPKLIPGLIKDIAKQNELETKFSISETEQGYGFIEEKVQSSTGITKVANRYSPYVDVETGETLYDDEFTEEIEEREEPGFLSEFKLKEKLRVRDIDRRTKISDPRVAVDFQGVKHTVKFDGQNYIDTGTGEIFDINKDLNYFQGVGGAYDVNKPTAFEKTFFNEFKKPTTKVADMIVQFVDKYTRPGMFGLGNEPDIIDELQNDFTNELNKARPDFKTVGLSQLIPLYEKTKAKLQKQSAEEREPAEVDFVNGPIGQYIQYFQSIINKSVGPSPQSGAQDIINEVLGE